MRKGVFVVVGLHQLQAVIRQRIQTRIPFIDLGPVLHLHPVHLHAGPAQDFDAVARTRMVGEPVPSVL